VGNYRWGWAGHRLQHKLLSESETSSQVITTMPPPSLWAHYSHFRLIGRGVLGGFGLSPV